MIHQNPMSMNPLTALPSLPGELLQLEGPTGLLAMRVSGQGAPLLLIHSVNAAPSTAEVAPIHRHYASTRRVFSLDLPGFGASARNDRAYSPRLMTDAIHAAVQEIQRDGGAQPVDALALSLSCEFLARAASERPSDFRSLALVSPTGFNGTRVRRGAPGSTMAIPWLLRLLQGTAAWSAVFKTLTRPAVIRHFMRKTFGSSQVDEWLCEQAVQNARVAGAERAPLYFLTGCLFSGDIHNVYDQLMCPVWMCHGVRGDFTDYRQKSRMQSAANWSISSMPTGALPHFEVPESFFGEYDRFLSGISDRSGLNNHIAHLAEP